jgi:hypothetical protein
VKGASDCRSDQSVPSSSSTTGSNIDKGMMCLIGLIKPPIGKQKVQNLAKLARTYNLSGEKCSVWDDCESFGLLGVCCPVPP